MTPPELPDILEEDVLIEDVLFIDYEADEQGDDALIHQDDSQCSDLTCPCH